jgi:hypothetical protein
VIALAFKYGDPGDFLDRVIMERTGGKFSHVELWIGGEGAAAGCYSSRAGGTAFATIDVTNPKVWNVVKVPFPAKLESALFWYCSGKCGLLYDGIGLVGIGYDMPVVHDPHARFCSEACFEGLQNVGGSFAGVGPRWMVAPSGHPRGGYGLYELTQALDVG